MSRDNKLIFWAMLVWGLGEGLWWYLLPIHIGNLGADPVQIGFVLSLGMVLMTLTFIPSGWLSDRFSRRTLMIIGWLDGTFAVVVIALARTWQQALPGLILYNLSAFNSPAISAYVAADVKPGQDMRRVYSLVFSGFTIGATISPSLGGFLADIIGLRQLFVLAAGIFAISTLIILFIHEQPVHQATHGNEPVSLRGNRIFLSLCGLFFVIHLVAHLGVPLAPNFLQDVRGLNLGWIGILGSVNGLGAAILTIGLGRWTRGRVTGILIGQAAVGMYAALMLGTTAVPFLAIAFFLRGGLAAVRNLAGARLGEMLPPGSMGIGFGIFQTVVNLAFTISPYVAGWLFALDANLPFLANLVLTLPAMLLTLLIGRQGPVLRRLSHQANAPL